MPWTRTVVKSGFSSRLYDDRSAILVTPQGLVSFVKKYLISTKFKHSFHRHFNARPPQPLIRTTFRPFRALFQCESRSVALFTKNFHQPTNFDANTGDQGWDFETSTKCFRQNLSLPQPQYYVEHLFHLPPFK